MPAFAGALGVITFYVGMSRCPIAGFFLGCEVFGWGIAPFLAIGVICALVGNRDYGYYGHGLLAEAHRQLAARHAAASADASDDAVEQRSPEK